MSSAITHPVDHTSVVCVRTLTSGTGKRNYTDFRSIVCSSEDKFGGTIIPRADIRHVWLILNQYLGATKITQLQNTRSGVQQEVLGLDISMTDALGVDICERAKELVNVELDL